MQSARPSVHVGVGDWMPRITLPLACGGLFDSWDPATSGMACVYWLGMPPASLLADALAGCETLLHVVCSTPDVLSSHHPSCMIDRLGELLHAFGASEPLAIVVDAAGRVVAVVPHPTSGDVASRVTQLYRASTPAVIHAQAPVLLLERVVESDLCAALIDYWQHHDKLANRVGSAEGNVVNSDIKRRLDVQLDDPPLFIGCATAWCAASRRRSCALSISASW